MDAYLSSRNGLALKYSGAATRACGIPLPSFSKRKQPLHSLQTIFFRAVAIFFRAVTGAVFSIASMRLSARGCSFLSGHVPFLLPVCPMSACPTPGPPPSDGAVHPHGALPQHIARIAAIEPARNPDERRSFALHTERLRQRRVHVCVDEQNALWRRAGTQAASRANVDLPGDPCPRRRPAFPKPLAFAHIVGFRTDDVDRLLPAGGIPSILLASSPVMSSPPPAGGIPASPAIASMRLRTQATTSPGKARSGRHTPASRAEIGIPGTVDMHYNNPTSVEMFGELEIPFAEHRDRTDAGFRGGHDFRTVGASPRNADDGIGFRKDAGDFGLQRAAKTQKQTHRRLPAKTYPSSDRMAENLTHALVRHLDFGRRPPPRRSSPPR